MKKILLGLLLMQSLHVFSQNNFIAKLNFTPIGDNYNCILNLAPDGQSLKSRVLPGVPRPFIFTDSVQKNGNQVTGMITILNWKCAFQGYQDPDSLHFRLINLTNNETIGSLQSGKSFIIDYSMKDVINEIIHTTRTYIYDTTLLYTPEWIAYEKGLQQLGGFLQDDIEVLALASRGIDNLPFTHYALNKMSDRTWKQYSQTAYSNETPASLKILTPKTALLTINGFGGNGRSLEKYMQQVISEGYQNLVIDLRENTGGGAGAVLALTKYLTKESKTAGALLTNKWFRNHTGLPDENNYRHFAVFSSGSTDDLIKSFSVHEGIILKAVPADHIFSGNLYILTSPKTASACEPFVYGMKYFKRATIVGTKTAGAMLSKIPFELKNGYKLFLPVTDYYTIDGERLDKKGVMPDILTSKEEALEKTIQLIGEKQGN